MKNLVTNNLRALWLDDIRDPHQNDWHIFIPLERPYEIYWVKSYKEFTDWISKNGLPDSISFDHDLGWDSQEIEEKTGLDCAYWLVNYCINNEKSLPLYNIQSANPVGKENIDLLLKNFNKYQKIE